MEKKTPSIMATLAALNYIYIPFLIALFYMIYSYDHINVSTRIVLAAILINSSFIFLITRYTIHALKNIDDRVRAQENDNFITEHSKNK